MTTVLVADDDSSILDLVQLELSGGGYKPLLASDGLSAWRTLTGEGADMLVADINMPGLDGYQLLRKVRADKRFAAMPVMILTIRGDAMSALKGLETGADEYLPKPFSKNEFLARIRRMEVKLPLRPPDNR
ncbi:MAG: response regulator [Elusimicrobiales bacterium]|nr:response regulator [Elusimicrobiales bacterium]